MPTSLSGTVPTDSQNWRSIGAMRIKEWQEKILGLVGVVVFSALWFLGKQHRLVADKCAGVLSVFGVRRERAVMSLMMPLSG